MTRKEIHFYKDLQDSLDSCDIYLTHNTTIHAISNEKTYINTYAISALDFAYLLDLGYDIYLHENKKCFQIKEGAIEGTDKEIYKGNDIRKMWIAGAFDKFFYN